MCGPPTKYGPSVLLLNKACNAHFVSQLGYTVHVWLGDWLSERLRRWSNKSGDVGSIPVTTEFFVISCDSNQVPKWFGTHRNLEVR